jgi:hypothetical protein
MIQNAIYIAQQPPEADRGRLGARSVVEKPDPGALGYAAGAGP